MIDIDRSEKDRIIKFVNDNELDYTITDNSIAGFSLSSYDGNDFKFKKSNEGWVVSKYDPSKDVAGSNPYEYLQVGELSQVLEQLSFYDNSISKSYWGFIIDSMQIGVDDKSYNENWYSDFVKDESWKVEDYQKYKIVSYENSSYKPELKSPFNTLHEVSPLNTEPIYTKVDKLYFEIHPVSCKDKNESYILKLLCNNDNVFKEYITYQVSKKKGLRLLIESIFQEMQRFKF